MLIMMLLLHAFAAFAAAAVDDDDDDDDDDDYDVLHSQEQSPFCDACCDFSFAYFLVDQVHLPLRKQWI